ncbi:SgcJ/EcaC family oxidoreductase [Planococcus liqunii]|uniref:YybH family protein n=1 Tax=Planococcus liqunii TaxID=3058394 RepID=UPI0026074E7E|nr:SgcJ/EcaC family oxidoreductase [Planococcus sp. N056]WKA50690.1 SgcJ/EcaC family oxidoreductase [Planococcus sp. N056]
MFATVQDLLTNYTEALYAGDAEKFLSGYAADVHIFDCFEQWEYGGIEAWRAFVTEWFSGMEQEGAKLRAEVKSQTAEEYEDSAHVHGIISFAALDQFGQPLRKTKNRFTFVLRKVDGSWRIVHEHSSVPVHMEDGRAIFG